MGKFAKIAINHKWAICLAFLAAIIISYPQIYFRYDHKDAYQGIDASLLTGDEYYYWSRIQEVRDGYPSSVNPFFKEGKAGPYSQPPLGEILAAYLGKLFFLDLNNTVLLTKTLFSFLLFLAIYSFIYLLFKEKLTAGACSTMIFFGMTLLSRHGPEAEFLWFSRMLHPLISSLFFFAFLSVFWLFWDTSTRLSARKKWVFGVISALILGFSFYVYPYTWIFLYAFSGILIFISLSQKDWQKIKRIILVLLLSLLVAVPYFINFYQMITHPNYLEFQQRVGLAESRTPIVGYLLPSLLIFFLLFFARKCRERYFFCLALVITPFIVLNQQLITGKILHPSHWHGSYIRFLAIIFIIVIFLNGIKKERFKKMLAALIIGAGIWAGFTIQSSSYAKYEESFVKEQRYGPILEWLNKNTQKEEVVLADPELSKYIPIYTSLNVAYSRDYAIFYLSIPQERLLNNEFLIYRLEGLKPEEAKEIFFRDREPLSFQVYGFYYQTIPDQVLLEFAVKYQAFYSQPLEEYLKKYQVKYVIWDSKTHPQWALDQYQFLKKVGEIENFVIYKL